MYLDTVHEKINIIGLMDGSPPMRYINREILSYSVVIWLFRLASKHQKYRGYREEGIVTYRLSHARLVKKISNIFLLDRSASVYIREDKES